MKVLAIDDDLLTRTLVQRVCEKSGYEISLAETGEEGLASLVEAKPDIIVLDWVMPKLSGIEIAKEITKSYEDEAPYIIMCTGKSRSEDLDSALAAGAKDYLLKSFEPAELKARLKIAESRILRDAEAKRNFERAQRLEQLEAMATLAQGVAHDFSNILGPILAYAPLVQRDYAEDQPNYRRMQAVTRSCHRGLRLVNQISLFTAIGRTPMERIEVRQVADAFHAILEENNVKAPIKMDVRNGSDAVVGASNLLGRALANLYENALSACDGDRTKIEIQIAVVEILGRKRLRIRVDDGGRGIPQNIQDQILQPFFTTEERTKGTGMGLAVVDGVIRAHRGKIAIRSVEGEGTRVEVLLPTRNKTTVKVSRKEKSPQETQRSLAY